MLTRPKETFPSGDYDAPNAPWNEMPTKCPECKGAGYRYYAFNLRERHRIEVTEKAFACLPGSEETAEVLGQHYCKADEPEICPVCDGQGFMCRK